MSPELPPSPDRAALTQTLILAGFFGLIIGFFMQNWQVAVEGAQVFAGVVDYDSATPFSVYQLKAWTALHHIIAPVLAAGVPELTLSIVVGALVTMVAFQAIAVLALTFNGSAVFSVLLSGFIFFTSVSLWPGLAYPIFLAGSRLTYGMVGFALAVLIIGLFGVSRYRTAGFLLGFLPAIHPFMGAWLIAGLLVPLVWDWGYLKRYFWPTIRWVAAGLTLTLGSLGIYLAFSGDLPAADPVESRRYVDAFLASWDYVRRPVPVAYEVYGTILICAVWLAFFARDLRREALLVLRLLLVFGVVGSLYAWLHTADPAQMPRLLQIVMPARLLNFDVFALSVLALSLMAVSRIIALRVGLVLTLAVSLGVVFLDPTDNGEPHLFRKLFMTGSAGALVVLALAARLWQGASSGVTLAALARLGGGFAMALPSGLRDSRAVRGAGHWLLGEVREETGVRRRALAALGGVSLVVMGTATASSLVAAVAIFPDMRAGMIDRTNNAVLARASAGEGILLQGPDLAMVQLRTRRPILIDPQALDMVLYATETAPAFYHILKRVYGADLFAPFDPDPVKRWVQLPRDFNRECWEKRAALEWSALRSEFGFTEVLVHAGWRLDLPLVAEDERYRLFAVPPPATTDLSIEADRILDNVAGPSPDVVEDTAHVNPHQTKCG